MGKGEICLGSFAGPGALWLAIKRPKKRNLRLRARPVFGFIPIPGRLAHMGTALLRTNLRKRSVGDAVDVVMSHAHELGIITLWHMPRVSPSEILTMHTLKALSTQSRVAVRAETALPQSWPII